ncbi:Ser/Thr protein kinase RdoA involved in Cpx stress response, MazF antagonist [Paenibacillaceae bacterium GAS479]|nr:Ser/Thr protein kinase RdoA involved in Cpx stress response, MazF antagonist [Paenibacillaceae bacterium GAS479]
MLKLKYLFNNIDLAEMLVKNWSYDETSLDMFKYYRISSNAIYPFKSEGKNQLLRFAPTNEKLKSNLLAELDFIAYLRDNRYGVLEAVDSSSGGPLIEVQTPWGQYFASVFKRVPGVRMDATDSSDDIVFSYGQALGRLHQLSSHYTPGNHQRWSYSDVLDWIQDVLKDDPEQTGAMQETEMLRDYFSTIPKSTSSFGLVHYDFEYDNVFYDEQSKSCYIIDFDDAMYHWYFMDIERAMDSLQDGISAEAFDDKKQCFMKGYLTEFEISYDLDELLPACRRFANLYGYARTYRSIKEKWTNEPEWLANLRVRLENSLSRESIFSN